MIAAATAADCVCGSLSLKMTKLSFVPFLSPSDKKRGNRSGRKSGPCFFRFLAAWHQQRNTKGENLLDEEMMLKKNNNAKIYLHEKDARYAVHFSN